MAFNKAKETELYDKYLNMTALFPLMGFPNENNKPDGTVVYQCFFPTARIALWKIMPFMPSVRYELNLYKPLPVDAHRDDSLTNHFDRFHSKQAPITVHDVVEAQLAINFLIQKYLPTGVTDELNREARTPTSAPACMEGSQSGEA